MVSAGLTDKMLIDAEEASLNTTVSGKSWTRALRISTQRKTLDERFEFLDYLVKDQK